MNDTTNMRKLMEAVQLNEYFAKEGESIEEVLLFNVFGDLTGAGADDGQTLSDYEEDFAMDPEWQEIENSYGPKARDLNKKIRKEASMGRKLTAAEANAIDSNMYDGSNAYETVEDAVESLPEIYSIQLDVATDIINGDIRDDYDSIQLAEAASSEQWEIAINNLIADGEERYAVAGATIEEKSVWQWVRSELHGMLDFQPDN